MSIEAIGEFLSGVSPWVAGGMIIAYCFSQYLQYRKDVREGSAVNGYTKAVQGLTKEVSAVVAQQQAMHSDLRAHVDRDHNDQLTNQTIMRELVGLTREQISTQQQLVKEIVRMNANLAGDREISSDNAKLIIEYQWSWCRDETFRIIANSLSNNHFRGHEERVARSVQRAWQRAATAARESLDRLNGLRYPYSKLFEDGLPTLWVRCWKLAIPLYHRGKEDPVFAEELSELQTNVHDLFDQALSQYFRAAEDIDEGELYAAHESDLPDGGAAARMSKLLREYRPGTVDLTDVDEELRQSLTPTPGRQLPVVRP